MDKLFLEHLSQKKNSSFVPNKLLHFMVYFVAS